MLSFLSNDAVVVESVDTGDLKSPGSDTVRVRVPSAAPNKYNPNQIFRIGKGFGLFVYLTRYEQEYFLNLAQLQAQKTTQEERQINRKQLA